MLLLYFNTNTITLLNLNKQIPTTHPQDYPLHYPAFASCVNPYTDSFISYREHPWARYNR